MFALTAELIASSTITLIICFLGLIGNILCAIVLFSKYMNPSSYVYLLQGLTIADISLLTLSSLRTLNNLGVLKLPTDQYSETAIFFWDWIGTSSTKYYTVTISLERFFVISFPFVARTLMTKGRSKIVACGVCLFCVALSCFSYVYNNWIDPNSFHIYVAIVLHLLPFVLVVVFNFLIFVWLRKIHKERCQMKTSRTTSDEYNITKMLFASGFVFGICYTFEFVRRVMNFMWPDYMNAYKYYDYTINHLADIFYVLNSSVNFLIYSLIGRHFRATFYKVFHLSKESKQDSSASRSVSSSTNQSVLSIISNQTDIGNA